MVKSVANGATSRRFQFRLHTRGAEEKSRTRAYCSTGGSGKFHRMYALETAAVFGPNSWGNFGTICSPNHAPAHCGARRRAAIVRHACLLETPTVHVHRFNMPNSLLLRNAGEYLECGHDHGELYPSPCPAASG
jgi:hypothetical protein